MPAAQLSLNEVYISQSEWPSDIGHSLALHCSDPWYREATTEFLVNYLGPQYDLLAVPGGPAVILISSMTFTADRPRVELLREHHQVTKFVAVAHLNCAYYKLRHKGLSDEGRKQKQLEDLQEFKRYVQKLAPEAEISLFFAEQADGNVRFSQVR